MICYNNMICLYKIYEECINVQMSIKNEIL